MRHILVWMATFIFFPGTRSFAQKTSVVMSSNVIQAQADSMYSLLQYKAAKPLYESLLQQRVNPATNLLQLLACNMGLRKYDEGIKNINSYLSLDPRPVANAAVQLYSSLAKIWSVNHDTEKGFEFLQKAVDSGYARLDEFDYESDYNSLRGHTQFIQLREKAELNAYPCLSNGKLREFDFMLGEWDIYTTPSTGVATHAGTGKWERISGGCALLENWTATGAPHNGKSINYYDLQKKYWEQVWVGSEGVGALVQRFLQGEYIAREKVMKFEYEMVREDGGKIRHRFRFFNLDANSARQLKESSMDGGKTWVVNYDYFYKRRK